MKKSFLYLIIIALVIGFTTAGVGEEKSEKQTSISTCPYLNSINDSSSSTECPFVMKKSEALNDCPYSGEKESAKCPYTEKMKEGNLQIQKKSKPGIEIKSS